MMNIMDTAREGYELSPVAKKITAKLMRNYSMQYPGFFIDTIHTVQEAAARFGFPNLVLQGSQTMNFTAELLFKTYRERWINDSNLKVSFIKPVFEGDEVTFKGKVIGKENDNSGKAYISIDVWAENSSGEIVMVGEAKIGYK